MNRIFLLLILLINLFSFRVHGQDAIEMLDDTTDRFYLTTVDKSKIDSTWIMDKYFNKSSEDFESIELSDLESNHDYLIFSEISTDIFKNPAFLIHAVNSNFKLYLNGKVFFDCDNPDSRNNRFLNYYIIPIESFSENKILTFHFHYDGIISIGEVSLAKIGEIEEMYKVALLDQKSFTKGSMVEFGFGSAFILLGLFLLILYFFFRRETGVLLLYFSILTLGVGTDSFFPFVSYYYSIPSDIIARLTTVWVTLIAMGMWGLINTISGKTIFAFSGIMVGVNIFIYLVSQFFLLPYFLIFEYITIAQIIIAIIVMIRNRMFKAKGQRFFAYSTALYLVLILFFTYFDYNLDLSYIGAVAVVLSLGMVSFNHYKQEKLKVNVFTKEIKTIKEQLSHLEIKNVEMQLEALKNQLNPHFLFNSLYALSALIKTDQDKATRFVEEFSDIFRYVLDCSERTVVMVKKELDFIRSYVYLQKIRYQENLKVGIDIPQHVYNKYIPPLSVQLLVENAIKHNEISDDFPLIIDIYIEDNKLVVKNKVKKLPNLPESKKVGLQNLKIQYGLITNLKPELVQLNNDFIVKLPLIVEEE